MNKLRVIIAAITGIASTTIFMGCVNNVTHNYSHFDKMSQAEAIQLIYELRVWNYNPKLKGDLRTAFALDLTRRYSPIKMVDPSGMTIDRASPVLIATILVTNPPSITSPIWRAPQMLQKNMRFVQNTLARHCRVVSITHSRCGTTTNMNTVPNGLTLNP